MRVNALPVCELRMRRALTREGVCRVRSPPKSSPPTHLQPSTELVVSCPVLVCVCTDEALERTKPQCPRGEHAHMPANSRHGLQLVGFRSRIVK